VTQRWAHVNTVISFRDPNCQLLKKGSSPWCQKEEKKGHSTEHSLNISMLIKLHANSLRGNSLLTVFILVLSQPFRSNEWKLVNEPKIEGALH
jgi:hypothetical protein